MPSDRIHIVEPYGNGNSNRELRHGQTGEQAFHDLKIHHPNTNANAVRTGNAAAVDRAAGFVEGELEAIRTRGDRNGIPLVSKDLILSNDAGSRNLMIPNPVAGYAEFRNDGTNTISLWSAPKGDPNRELVGQVLHGAKGTSPYKDGDFIPYGAPLIRQSDAGSRGAVHAHIELEPAQYKRYLGDILNDRITLNHTPTQTGADARTASARPAASADPMADGVLKHGEKGEPVKTLQEKLSALGYTGADGKPLAPDRDFGDNTLHAVQQFQRDHALKVDGKAGPKTFEALDAATREHAAPKPSAATAEPALAPKAGTLADPAHPDHALYGQALDKLKELDSGRRQAGQPPLFADEKALSNAAGQLAFESKVGGMKQIDSVAARADGAGIFAMEGKQGDPAAHRVYVDRAQAAGQSVETSTQQLASFNQQFPQEPAQTQTQAQAVAR
ncbi:Putative peptidoglycan binding domain-containing protein [Pseudoxanthomonas sp. GM95]|uniref:peptidoglycan-binding domain-containing protein n=1 Tax=Pseudoxanthomonas sp. GM95 TaxID=1881043 RepID=UPI0008C4B897|nr:peptidoglycan-binding domain-containing protein [Pseudoxanthomonas sp. GM95]SEL74954.1 Putative peptidoglycan binding domain-containing protein [Pseudoxanthomonas sp. GM95]